MNTLLKNLPLKTRIQSKIDDLSNWTTTNIVLLDGEIGIVRGDLSNDIRIKIGNGIDNFIQLPYVDDARFQSLVSALQTYSDILDERTEELSSIIESVSGDVKTLAGNISGISSEVSSIQNILSDYSKLSDYISTPISSLENVISAITFNESSVIIEDKVAKISFDFDPDSLSNTYLTITAGESISNALSGAIGDLSNTYLAIDDANNLSNDICLSVAGLSTAIDNISMGLSLAISSTSEFLDNLAVSVDVISDAVDLKANQSLVDEISNTLSSKFNSSGVAPEYSPTATYFINEYVTHDGFLYQCKTPVIESAWDPSKWNLVDMVTPDATIDITSTGELRVVSADGSILWQQGYNLGLSSSAKLLNGAVNKYDFNANSTAVISLVLPTITTGKVGDLILDVTNPPIDTTLTSYSAFSDASTYVVGDVVGYDSKMWTCIVAVTTAGAWTGTANWTEICPRFEITGLNNTVCLMVIAGKDLNEMLQFSPGSMSELYFTMTAFTLSGLPTWKVGRLDLENGGDA